MTKAPLVFVGCRPDDPISSLDSSRLAMVTPSFAEHLPSFLTRALEETGNGSYRPVEWDVTDGSGQPIVVTLPLKRVVAMDLEVIYLNHKEAQE